MYFNSLTNMLFVFGVGYFNRLGGAVNRDKSIGELKWLIVLSKKLLSTALV